MHDLPRQKLSELVAEYGHELCDDAKRLEGMLKDVLRNEHKRETSVLLSALREGVAAEFRNSVSGMPLSAVAAKMVRQLPTASTPHLPRSYKPASSWWTASSSSTRTACAQSLFANGDQAVE